MIRANVVGGSSGGGERCAQSSGVVGDGEGFRQGGGKRGARGRRLVLRVVLALAVPAALSLLSCGKGQTRARPVASLADGTAAGQAFERLRIAWVRNDPSDRPALRHDIEAFVTAFPNDGLARLVRIYWALSLMDPPADWSQAERRLESLAPPPPGASHDLYVIAVAKLRRYHHQPDAAFALLRPIVGNIVDARARALLQEELTFDALEAREPYEAIAYMDAWLRGASEEDRQTSEAKVAVALGAVPEGALRGSLAAMRASAKVGESHGYGVVIQRLVGERLGQIAANRGDAALARWLLDAETGGGTPMLGEEVSAALVQLATSRRGIGSVAGRTVGLVLPTSSSVLRDEVADVLRGVLWALDLGRDAGEGADGADAGKKRGPPIRLVTRDDGGDPSRLRVGMEEVAGEGASVILTALDGETATEALEWAASSSLNVIVLAAPLARAGDAGSAPMSLFSVGEDWPAEVAVLAAALEARSSSGKGRETPIATLTDTEVTSALLAATRASTAAWQPPTSCDLAPTSAGESRFPLGEWEKSGVERWLVAGSKVCADDLLRGLRQHGRRGVMALSLEASDAQERAAPAIHCVTATTGIIPLSLAPASSTDPRVEDARAMVAWTGAPAGWWTALGHDAAILARTALSALPADTTSDTTEIARRRMIVRQGLAAAHAPLWTSEHDGFDAARAVPRTVRVVDLGR